MSDIQATFMATVVDEWVRGGVTDAVVCPGNRSSLMAAAMAANPGLRLHSFVDERSAGFFALGMALATQRPVVVWTTSGTAVSELRAAAVEADHSSVPLLIATADRPPEQRHIRDWQSVDQSSVFEPHLRWRFDPGVADEAMAGSWRSIASRSVLEAEGHTGAPGPIHLNLAIREPWTFESGELPAGRDAGAPWHSAAAATASTKLDLSAFAGLRGVVAGGAGAPADTLVDVAAALGWPLLTDVRCSAAGRGGTVGNADLLLRDQTFADAHRPEAVLHMGDPLVSKAVSTWLATAPRHWVVSSSPWQGPAAAASEVIQVDWSSLTIEPVARVTREWVASWLRAAEHTNEFLHALTAPFCEPVIAAELSRQAADAIFLGTSMPVRDFDAYGTASPDVKVFANRGASGMDGLLSTAAGIAAGESKAVVALVGDLSFLYDLGALWNIDPLGDINLTIVVVDNNGGGIFDLVPQLQSMDRPTLEHLTVTPRNRDITAIASALGANACRVENLDELAAALDVAKARRGVDVICAVVDRAASASHREAITRRFVESAGA